MFISTPSGNPNSDSITIRNGIIQNFNQGIVTQNPNYTPAINGYFTKIHINNIVFNNDSGGVAFYRTNSSTVSDCVFTNVEFGIGDNQSQGGSTYINDVFNGFISGQFAGLSFSGLFISGNTPYTVEHCHFEAPTN